MIKNPEQFRIGNYVQRMKPEGTVAHVTGNMIGAWSCGFETALYGPIELDGNWLTAFSFWAGHGRWENIIRIEEVAERSDGTWYQLELDDTHVFVPRAFRYVHELQNLFYELTGQELRIKRVGDGG